MLDSLPWWPCMSVGPAAPSCLSAFSSSGMSHWMNASVCVSEMTIFGYLFIFKSNLVSMQRHMQVVSQNVGA